LRRETLRSSWSFSCFQAWEPQAPGKVNRFEFALSAGSHMPIPVGAWQTRQALPTGELASIDRPQARRRELQQVAVGIAEIDAAAAALPVGPPFDRDIMRAQALLPLRQLVGGNRKRDVQRAAAVVRRNGAARHVHGLARRSAAEQQEHAAAADRIGAKAWV